MAFFKSKEKEKTNEAKVNKPKVQTTQTDRRKAPVVKVDTVVSEGITISGNVEGNERVLIDGCLRGDIKVNEVTIGKKGSVEGSIIAKKVIISGTLQGSVTCGNLDIMQSGKVSQSIHAVNLVINGTVTGAVIADDSIIVSNTGKVKVETIKSKRIMVKGKVEGKVIASELLDVGSNGYVNGQICIKNIKTEEGGKVIGSMEVYQEEESVKQVSNQGNNNKQKKNEVIDTEIA